MRLGRFYVERGEQAAIFRVHESDNLPLVHFLLLAGLAAVALLAAPFDPQPRTQDRAVEAFAVLLVFVALGISLCFTTRQLGLRGAARRSTYPRVRRRIEARWSEGAYRSQEGLTLTVDEQSFSGRELLGVVVARSVEKKTVGYAAMRSVKRIQRFAPTLVLRDRAYELEVYEGADEAGARELADAVASALARRDVKAARVQWRRTEAIAGFWLFAHMLALVGATALAIGAAASAAHHQLLGWAAFAVTVGASPLFGALIARASAAERSAGGRVLRQDAERVLVASGPDP